MPGIPISRGAFVEFERDEETGDGPARLSFSVARLFAKHRNSVDVPERRYRERRHATRAAWFLDLFCAEIAP